MAQVIKGQLVMAVVETSGHLGLILQFVFL